MSTTTLRLRQIEGFTTCLLSFLRRWKIFCCNSKLTEHLEREFRSVSLEQLPKVFKLSLATFFSKELGQELPKDHESSRRIFDGLILRLLRKSYKRPSRKVRILWDLLQCKDLAHQVPSQMIQGAYEKHRMTLSAVGATPECVLGYYRTYCREFCEQVQRNFTEKNSLPPRRAYFNCKRSSGGCLEVFKAKKRLIVQNFEPRHQGEIRIDPVVLHLFGEPGKGKSFVTTKVVKRLSQRFGYVRPSFYSRSNATDHWDGYSGNPLISIIDDVFTSADVTDDANQLIQICSNVDYVLPMADLREKGTKFTSDFLFLSSNYPTTLSCNDITNKPALMRRVFPAFKLLGRRGNLYRVQRFDYVQQDTSGSLNTYPYQPGVIREFLLDDLIEYLVNFLIETHRDRREVVEIRQPLTTVSAFEPSLGLVFPRDPPERIARVMTHAIPEPLKVRMITKAEEDVWILKPVQKAMWKALQAFPCFKLTSTPEIPFDFVQNWSTYKDSKTLFVSGDYESATDNLHMDITRIMAEELCKVLPPQYHKWVKWECGHHEIHYPPKTGLEPILQTRGQLMGSLLSFPTLCVANAAGIGMVKKQDLSELEALINGDDIYFKDHPRKIRSWKRVSSSMGLIPSVGKNYISSDWGAINSQLLFNQKCIDIECEASTRKGTHFHLEHLATGSFGPQAKLSNYLANLKESLRLEPESKAYFIKKAKPVLRKTPQSVDIPTEYGGLGNAFDRDPTLLDKEIYFFFLSRKGPKKVSSTGEYSIYRVPKHLYRKYAPVLHASIHHEIPDFEVESIEMDRVFDWRRFRNFQKFYKRVPSLRDRIRQTKLTGEIPLNLVKPVTIRIPTDCESVINNLKIRL